MGITTREFGPYAKGSRLTTAEMDENFNYLNDNIIDNYNELNDNKQPYTVAATGVVIGFANPQIYNTASVPATGNFTNNLTGARIGIVQKIYHNHSIAPTTPANWVLIGEGFYIPGTLNIIYAEWCDNTRVEYWITQ
jgi:ABC-type xylose transport system permease subunit